MRKKTTANTGAALANKGLNGAAAGGPVRRRAALADSSNKVPQAQVGGKAGAIGALGGKLGLVVEETKKPVSKRNRSFLSKSAAQDEDGDAVMNEAENNPSAARPIKSLRSAVNASSSAKTRATSSAVGVLAGKSTNVPHKSGIAAGSTKNAGLKRTNRPSAASATAEEPKKSTKNAGLRVKREIQDVTVDDDAASVNEDEKESDPLHEDVEPHPHERRRSKRLRPSEPEDAIVDDAKVAGIVGRVMETDLLDTDGSDGDAKDAGWEDLDIGDEEDPLMVAEYVKEIHEYMKELEVSHAGGKSKCRIGS